MNSFAVLYIRERLDAKNIYTLHVEDEHIHYKRTNDAYGSQKARNYDRIEASWKEPDIFPIKIEYTCDKQTTELSSFVASSTIKRFGLDLSLRIAVANSSPFFFISSVPLLPFGGDGLWKKGK
uniref:Uncharacterized protein n=1 Tax=Romanomermis culicivorax TaxID=13658 RepID=A0A915IMN7_ROMCU